MPAVPPSRSELEKALRSSRSHKSNPRAANKRSNEDLQRPTQRRATVLGGDPSGVKSKSIGHRLWSKMSSIGLINLFAATLVALIMIAFFWPSSPKGVREVALTPEQVEAASFYSESRIDDIPELTEGVNDSFVRESDLERASEFREQEFIDTRTTELLALAETYLTEGQYTEPQGANATEAYREVLSINPNNVDARRGIEYIIGRFLSTGSDSVEQGDFAAARSSLDRLALFDQDSQAYQQLAELIRLGEQQAQIARLIERAQVAFAAGNYILPAQNNAWSMYQQVLELEPDNSDALEGAAGVVNNYIALANSSAIAGEYQAAAGYLATVGVIDPNNSSIPLIEQIISTAQPLADRAQAAQESTNERVPEESIDASLLEVENTAAAQSGERNPPVPNLSSETVPISDEPRPSSLVASNDARVSQSRTPAQEAAEQAAFDRQYLDRGLAAYYSGDYTTAVQLLTPLADRGISRAQFRIAYMHLLGRGFPRNRNEADRIIRAALPAIQEFAAEGRAWAQSDLGSLYEDGLVLPRDYKEAFFWYRAAAEQGYAGAQTNLGILYARGLGVATSRRTAIEWFERAAAQGDASATKNLEALGVL